MAYELIYESKGVTDSALPNKNAPEISGAFCIFELIIAG
jgi:hypothetical protein